MIIFRYLAKQVLVTMLAVTFVLLMTFMSGRFIKYLVQAASGELSPDILFAIMAYRLPGFLELILPLGFFIGILLAYGRMYLESEMTVLHACGLSDRRLLGMTLCFSGVVTLLVGMMSLYVSPWGMQQVEKLFAEQSKVTAFEVLFPGRFQTLQSGERVTYMESLSDDKKTMFNVFISGNTKQGDALTVIYAKSGTQRVDEETGERFLVLHDGRQYEGSPGQADYRVVAFDSYGIRIDEPDAEERSIKEEALASSELMKASDLESRALLQWRLSLPLLVPIITLLAVSVSRVNPRQGRFFHLFPAMLIYVTYLGMLIVARKNLAKGELPEWLGLWVVHVFFFGLSLALLTRSKWLHIFQSKRGNGETLHAKN